MGVIEKFRKPITGAILFVLLFNVHLSESVDQCKFMTNVFFMYRKCEKKLILIQNIRL